MDRKLASIQRISGLKPIKDADRIEQANVLGWSMVVKKGEFKEGDMCVFFEIDSVLSSDKEWAKFLEPKKFRVKTAKFKGVLVQGLALPLSILPAHDYERLGDIDPQGPPAFGDDVTIQLGVTKYEPPLPQDQEICGPFPGIVPKTDEMRLQSVPAILEEIKGVPLAMTVKLDGTSCTILKRDGELVVCGRNWQIREGNNKYWNVARKYRLAEVLPEGIAIQGEIVGPGIQNNRLDLKETDLFVFNVYDTRNSQYLSFNDGMFWCAQNGVKHVPIAHIVPMGLNDLTIERFLELAEGTYEGTNNMREGIVIRPLEERRSEVLGGRLSFKVISNAFLLKHEE